MAENLFSLSEDLRREERENQEAFRLQLANQLQDDPERSRRLLNVSLATGIPEEVADADLENLEKQVLAGEFNIEKWRDESPAWSTFASENRYHLSVLKEDQEGMGTFERSIEQLSLGFQNTKAQVEVGLIQARRSRGEEYDDDEERLKEYKELLVEHEFGAEGFTRFLVKNAKMFGPTARSIGKGLELGLGTAAGFAWMASQAGQAGPLGMLPEEIITVPAAGLMGFKVGFATGTGMSTMDLETGFAYDQYLEMGIDKRTAQIAANAGGLINASLESLAIGKAVKYLPWLRGSKAKIAQQITGEILTRPTVLKATGAVVVRFGEVLGTEMVTEIIQESVTSVIGDLIRKEGQGAPLTFESWVDQSVNVALETMQGAFIMSSIGPGMSYYADFRQAREADRMMAVYRALGSSTKNSTTREKVPGKYREFVERMTKDGPVDTLYVDINKFDTYFHENDLDPDEVANDLGIEKEDLDTARMHGGKIGMPIMEYADKIAPTEHHTALAGDLSVSEEQMSYREAELFRKNNPELVAAMEKSLEPVEDGSVKAEILNDLTGQLVAQGYDPETARMTAHVLLGVPNLAERMGIDPRKLYEMRLEGVRSMTPEAADNVDMEMDPILDALREERIPSQREIFGDSLIDFIVKSGGLLPDSELDVRDFLKQMQSEGRMGAVSLTGDTLDGLAEIAHEAGYIPARDPDMLLEAIDRELAGEPQFGTREGNPEIQELVSKMEEAAQFFEMEGIDLKTMSNAEVRKLLEGVMSLEHRGDDGKPDWLEVFEALVTRGETPENLAAAMVMMPRVADEQNFGEQQFTDRMRIQGSTDYVTADVSVQEKFDEAVQRRNTLKTLMDCVDG